MGLTYIKSKNNQTFKFIQQIIKSRKKRSLNKLYWLEGEKSVKTFLGFENKKFISKIVTTEKFCSVLQKDFKLDVSRFDVVILDNKLFEEISLINTRFRAGLLVAFERTKTPSIGNNTTDILYLSDVQDPGHLGTLIRSCAAMSVRNLVITKLSRPMVSKGNTIFGGIPQHGEAYSFDSFAKVMKILKINVINFPAFS